MVEDLALDTSAPGIRSFMRLKQRMNVLLPQPEGPMNAVTKFLRTSIVTSFNARFPL